MSWSRRHQAPEGRVQLHLLCPPLDPRQALPIHPCPQPFTGFKILWAASTNQSKWHWKHYFWVSFGPPPLDGWRNWGPQKEFSTDHETAEPRWGRMKNTQLLRSFQKRPPLLKQTSASGWQVQPTSYEEGGQEEEFSSRPPQRPDGGA